MKTTLLFVFISFVSFRLSAQNLVPNSSFENTNGLPNSWIESAAQFNGYMNNWIMPTGGTTDIFSRTGQHYANCCAFGNEQSQGVQAPRTGNTMVGIYNYGYGAVANYREYIEVALNTPLEVGQRYYVEFYVSLADRAFYGSNNIGAYFSDTLVLQPNLLTNLTGITPQINEANLLMDTTTWTKISGDFTAISPANYLLIGNFYDDQNTQSQYSYPRLPRRVAYYFIDDVLVVPITSIKQNAQDINVMIYPNPFKTDFTIITNQPNEVVFTLYDATSRPILSHTFTHSTQINTETLPKGVYFYTISTLNGSIKNGKMVKY